MNRRNSVDIAGLFILCTVRIVRIDRLAVVGAVVLLLLLLLS